MFRLSVPAHAQKQVLILHFLLCGQNSGPGRGHRYSFSCQVCSVLICLRTYPGLRKNCWSLSHSSKILKLRSTPRLVPTVAGINAVGVVEDIEDDEPGGITEQVGEKPYESEQPTWQ
eukprot:IDg18630t1